MKKPVPSPKSAVPSLKGKAASAPSAVKPAQLETRNPELETVLLAVTGMSPAVLTETIWAPRVKPSRPAL